ncbi:MAG: hypothetical protein ACPGE8_01235 [Candidatus Poseidoniaceae archaeon]
MSLRELLLFLHIACGCIALVTMVIAYTTKKGPKAHAKVGRIYGYGMIGVGLTAVILFFMGASSFLLLIAFFSTYLVLVGWRFASNRKGTVTGIDTALMQVGFLGGIALLAFGAFIFTAGTPPFGLSKSFSIAPIVFGVISIALAAQQYILNRDGTSARGKKRISLHVTYMGAGTISTVTAFTITIFDHSVFTWLGATAIGTPLLMWNQMGVSKGRIASSVTKDEEE